MTQKEWAMIIGQANGITDSMRENKRYKEQQLLEQAMREKEEEWKAEQLALQKAMQERQIKRMDEDSERWQKNFARDENRYLDGIINQSVKDKIESDRYAEQAAARHAATQHGQKIDLSKLDLAMMEHELRTQQLANQPIGSAQYGWGVDEKGDPAFMPMSQTMSVFRNGIEGTSGTPSASTGATQTAAPSTPTLLSTPASAPNTTPATPSSAMPNSGASASPIAPDTTTPELQPKDSSFWRDFGTGAWNTTKWLAGANVVPALAETKAGQEVRRKYNETKEERDYYAKIQAAERAKPKPPPESNYALLQVQDFANMWLDPVKPAARKAWDTSASAVKQRYKDTKAEREQQRAAQLAAEERELRRRAERLDALNQAQY